MRSGTWWRLGFVLMVVLGAVIVNAALPVRLGLDLQGGTQVVLEAQDTDTITVDGDVTDRTLEVLRRRVDALGVTEPSIQRSGDRRIIIELPGVDNPEEAVELVGRTAQLSFHPVLGFATGGMNLDGLDLDGLDLGDLDLDDLDGPVDLDDLINDGTDGDDTTEGDGATDGTDETGEDDSEVPAGDTPGEGEASAMRQDDAADDQPADDQPADDQPGDEPTDEPTDEPATDGEEGDEGDELTDEELEELLGGLTGGGQPVEGELVLPDEDGNEIRLGPAQVTGEAVSGANARVDPFQGWLVELQFRDDRAWIQMTAEAACRGLGDPQRRVAIVLDDTVITSPQVGQDVQCGVGLTGGTTIISGSYDEDGANELALLIRAGALPVPVEIVEQRTVGPTLGQAAIDAGFQAALIGGALTILFLLAYYRFLGLIAAVALGVYALISMAALQGIGAVLTLPGIAGFVLAVGMAVDGNILVFERSKEEYQSGKPLRTSLREGFTKAFSAIADSQVTTLLAAMLLYFFATAGVRGFGVTLSIGAIVSIFTSLVVTRVLIELAARSKFLTSRPKLWGLEVGRGLRKRLSENGPDIVGKRKMWFAITGIVSIVMLSGVLFRGMPYGLEFTGGRLIEYEAAGDVDLEEVREGLADIGFARAVVQETGEQNVAVRTRQLTPEEETSVDATLEGIIGSSQHVRDEFVGPTIGNEIRTRALIALALALGAQLLYLAIRFRWTFATASIVAMFHDLSLVIGIFAWMGKEFDGVFVASLLTVIGYSVNDTVVIFDRIREERGLNPKWSFARVANFAVLDTLPRTINTGLSSLFILFSLWILGGDTLSDFALALIIGVFVGTYSSVVLAMPLATELEERWEAPPPQPANSRATRGSRPVRRPASASSTGKLGSGLGGPSPSAAPVPPKKRRKSR